MVERRTVWFAWAGFVAVAFAVGSLVTTPQHRMMESRAQGIAQSIDVLDHGGPPLLISDVPYRHGLSPAHLAPAGATDDQGIYLYLPVLGRLAGEHDPEVLMHWLFTACFAVVIGLTPLIMLALFASPAAAVVTPLLLIVAAYQLEQADLYWVQAWIALLGIPLLVLAHRWWTGGRRRAALAVLVPLLVAAGVATSIRSHAGLGIAVSAVGLVLLAPSHWRRRLGAALVLVAAYASVALAFVAVRAYRDSQVTMPATSLPTSHPLWHPAYLGLGYLPNKYGIAWNDSVAADAVERARPGTTYLSSTYEHTLRRLYLNVVRDDPAFALRTYATKLGSLLHDAARYFWLLGVLIAAAIAARRTRALAVAFLLALPTLAVSLASPLLAVPIRDYELGWLGAILAATLLGVAWVVARSEAAFNAQRRPRLHVPPRPAAAAAAAVLVATALATVAHPDVPSAAAMYAANATDFAPPAAAPALTGWRFPGRLPSGWKAAAGVSLERDDDGGRRSLYVRTTTGENAVQLSTRTSRLPAGRYSFVGHVLVLAGGLGISVARSTGQHLATSSYWYGEGDFPNNLVGTTFTLARPATVTLSLQNWTNVAAASAWVLQEFHVVRVGL